MRASTSLEEGAPILVGRHIIYGALAKLRGVPMHYRRALFWRGAPFFGGSDRVKATFRGGRLLGPTFLPQLIQAIDLEEDLGQIPRSEGGNAQDMDQASKPLIKT